MSDSARRILAAVRELAPAKAIGIFRMLAETLGRTGSFSPF